MKLGIISHTEHHLVDGRWQGLTPTVREIDFISRHFDRVVHAAYAYENLDGFQTHPYNATNVSVVPLRPSGGGRFRDKWSIVRVAPANLQRILGVAREVDVLQVRLPTGMGMYLLPALRTRKVKTPMWAKYAGNWKQEKAPLSYAAQRWWLQRYFKGPVTINGSWPGLRSNFLAFENPCLTRDEVTQAREAATRRRAVVPATFCFVGRLEVAKGVGRILQALKELPDKQRIKEVHFVGDGPDRSNWENAAKETGVRCVFHGVLDRDSLATIFARSHYLLLPSDSEGFPKVVAEAAAFGVIPVVSAISAIPQYINKDNGYLWPIDRAFSEWFSTLDLFNVAKMEFLSVEIRKVAELFTYERYCARLHTEVLPLLGLEMD